MYRTEHIDIELYIHVYIRAHVHEQAKVHGLCGMLSRHLHMPTHLARFGVYYGAMLASKNAVESFPTHAPSLVMMNSTLKR